MDRLPPPEPLVLSINAAKNGKQFSNFKTTSSAKTAAATTPAASERMKALQDAIILRITGKEAIDIYNTFQLTSAEEEDYDLIVLKFEECYTSSKTRRTRDPSFVHDIRREMNLFNSFAQMCS